MINYGKLELNVSDLNYTMEVKDLFIAKGKKAGTISIKPRSVITKTLPIKVEVKKLFKAMRIYVKNEKVHYHLTVKGFIQNDKLSEERTPVEIEKDGDMRLKK